MRFLWYIAERVNMFQNRGTGRRDDGSNSHRPQFKFRIYLELVESALAECWLVVGVIPLSLNVTLCERVEL